MIQYYLAIVGIDAYHASQKCLLNKRSVAVLVGLGLSFITKTVYLIYKAQSVLEYTESLYIVSTIIGIALAFTIVLCEMPELFAFINNFEIIVNERKRISNACYFEFDVVVWLFHSTIGRECFCFAISDMVFVYPNRNQ